MTQTSGGSFAPVPIDFEAICLSTDGGMTRRAGLVRFDEATGQFITFEADGVSPVLDGAVIVPCNPPSTIGIISGGTQIAGPTRAASPAFNGAPQNYSTSALPGMLQSITVTAFATTPGTPGQTANQVIAVPPGGDNINLAPGETRTWSVVRDQDLELKREFEFVATGNAYATITWTYFQ